LSAGRQAAPLTLRELAGLFLGPAGSRVTLIVDRRLPWPYLVKERLSIPLIRSCGSPRSAASPLSNVHGAGSAGPSQGVFPGSPYAFAAVEVAAATTTVPSGVASLGDDAFRRCNWHAAAVDNHRQLAWALAEGQSASGATERPAAAVEERRWAGLAHELSVCGDLMVANSHDLHTIATFASRAEPPADAATKDSDSVRPLALATGREEQKPL
jgi:hypothetical protein